MRSCGDNYDNTIGSNVNSDTKKGGITKLSKDRFHS